MIVPAVSYLRRRSLGRLDWVLWLMIGLAATGCRKSPETAPSAGASPSIKIGFVVKAPEDPWFQLEWKFAEQAARKLGFTLVKIGASDGEKVLSAIDSLATGGAQGLVICTPDARLGPSIVAKTTTAGMKLLTVDDQFVGANGQPMEQVHHLGISAGDIGRDVGAALYKEFQRRGWSVDETGVCVITFDELATTRERTDGAMASLVLHGFPAGRIFRTAERATDIPSGFDAATSLLAKQPAIKRWLFCGVNDNAVLGAVRALEGLGVGEDRAIGIGINGTDCISELEKSSRTAFFGSMLLSAREHGFKTCEMMFHWLKDGQEPPLQTRTRGVFIQRENFRAVLKAEGIAD